MNNNNQFNGQHGSNWTELRFAQNFNTNKAIKLFKCAELLDKNRERIKFHNLDYEQFIDYLIASKNPSTTLVYLDPPYHCNNGKVYKYSKMD